MSMLLREALARVWAGMCRPLTSCSYVFICHVLRGNFNDIMHIDINPPLCVTRDVQ
jgi:hypothetical protein